MLQKLHLLLVLLLWSQLILVSFILLDELPNRFCAHQVNNVIFIASLVASNILIWSVSPVTIYSKFVHDL